MPDAPVAIMPPIVAFAPGSTGEEHALRPQALVELAAGHAGLDGDVHVVDREAQDRVHAAHVDRHAAAQGGDVALERRPRAERDDRRAVLGADAHEARDLVDVERVGDEVGRRGRVERLVGPVLPADVLAREDAVGRERRGERVAQRRDVGAGEAAGLGRRAHGPESVIPRGRTRAPAATPRAAAGRSPRARARA